LPRDAALIFRLSGSARADTDKELNIKNLKGSSLPSLIRAIRVHPWFPPEADPPMEDKSFLI